MKDLSELIEQWRNENKTYSFEGTSGVNKFKTLCESIGYKDGNYIGYDMAIMNFLSDNPGAIDTLIEWIGEQDLDDWKDNLIDNLETSPDEDEDEDEDGEDENGD